MRSWCSPSTLRGISRAAWRRAVAGTPSLTGVRHEQKQYELRHLPLPLNPPAPPIAHGLAERLFSSSSSTKRSTKKSAEKKETPVDSASSGDLFYLVRKGDVIGIYGNLADCQAQVSNSVCDPSVTVVKGSSLHKETEEYLPARGLKNALYSINTADAKDELFDDLALCPFQQPDGNATSTLEKPQEMETAPSKKHPKVAELEPLPDSDLSCILEFDGANKGNPSRSGAGVIVRRLDGSMIAQLREGLGNVTKNTAEYCALLLGLTYAAKKGFKYIRAQGDAELICNQVQGVCRPKRYHMVDLCKKVKNLKDTFLQFEITHVLREFNADVHAQAKLATELPDAKDELFDDLALCPFQQPDGNATSTLEKPQEMLSCIVEFDGANKGNPSKSGAGVIVRRLDGSVIAQLREGLGNVTKYTAEYRALLLGLRYAAKKGFKYIRAQGDAELICNQVKGVCRPKRYHMVDLCKKVKKLKGRFYQFQITHVFRVFNADVHAQAKLAAELPADAKEELFGDLALCPFQETGPSKKHPKVGEHEPLPDSHLSCILEFDGACLGNPSFPRKSGAGVIVRRPDGSVIAQLREGLGSVTDNTAEYRALLLGLTYAAKKGFKYIHVQGDSENVCKQVQGVWRTKRDHIVDLCKKVNQLKGRFLQFQITLVLRKRNADADAQARLATKLPVGGIQEESNIAC